jgi:UDP-N-acetylglucosamine diphosphorylase/glucosamine-1-phosphate N-acetyltransferase
MIDLIVHDDSVARDFAPLSLTRPGGELLFGAFVQRARLERALEARCIGHSGCSELTGFEEPGTAPVLNGITSGDVPRVILSSRVVPDWGAVSSWPARRALITVAGRMAGWYLPPDAPPPSSREIEAIGASVTAEEPLQLNGRWIDNVWDLVTQNADQLQEDLAALAKEHRPIVPPQGLDLIGYRPGMLQLGADVTIEPGVVFDFSEGPIRLEDGVIVKAFTRLAGPSFVGRGSVLLGGSCSHVSIGPRCKVHGEVEASVVLGYSNKAHDGFLGHAYLGCWVNLGAMTTNSDLKNNYGSVRLWTPRGSIDTGAMKIGCLLGDHVKTGIGSLLNTGTVVGVGSNLFGSALPPKYVPPFSWGSGDELEPYDVEKFLATAELAMGRRQVTLSSGMRQVLRAAWERSRSAGA